MATGTKLMKEISDQFLICKICQEPFKDPKTLSCLHTFCCTCVQQQYDTDCSRPSRYALYGRTVTCPVCRKKTELPTGGVRRLPDNFLVSNLTEVLAKRRCSSKVPPCEICHTVRSRSSDACAKCLDCDKLLCRACVELHSGTKVTQEHSLIDLQGQKDIECKAHPEETVRFYCERCEECICVVCTFQEHKDHEVCSFSDGLPKHKAALEGLLGRSRERLEDLSRRLKVVEKVENLSKELKERIRDLAISYTSQVRAREKELLRKVDEAFSGEVWQLAEKKAWLQETQDNLQSACNLTEIVVKDKGVEMLLLKKEIQGKMDHLLSGALPPEPSDLAQLDVTFVPGEVRLGDISTPGFRVGGEQKKENGTDVAACENAAREAGQVGADGVTPNAQPCRACLKRKRREEREKGRADEQQRGKVTKSALVQTLPQELSAPFPESPEGARLSSAPHSAAQTDAVSTSGSGPEGGRRTTTTTATTSRRPSLRARGTMTARQDVRTLKIQTEESCLRDTYLGHPASRGSAHPNVETPVIATPWDQPPREALTTSRPLEGPGETSSLFAKETKDAGVSTDISFNLTNADAVSTLCQGEGRVGVNGSDLGKPDLLAETGSIPVPVPSLSARIRSRKVQTEITALESTFGEEDQCIIDDQMKRAVFRSSGSGSRSQSTIQSVSKEARASRSSCDVGVMTSFNVKLVPDTVDVDTVTEAVTSVGVGVMTSPETRTVYIQTLMKRLRSAATCTDSDLQTSAGSSTQPPSTSDAETAMPPLLHESKTTWTDVSMTSERATSTTTTTAAAAATAGTERSDAFTLTWKVPSHDFSAQTKPESEDVSTSTSPPPLRHHQTQAAPTLLTSTGTAPDSSSHLGPRSDSQASPFLSDRGVLSGNPPTTGWGSQETGVAERRVVPTGEAGVGTEEPPRCVTIATGPSCPMASWRSISTDTFRLLQAVDKETGTPTVKTLDDWTNTPQPQLVHTGVTPFRPATADLGVSTTPVRLMEQAANTEVITWQDTGTESGLVVCDSETLTERVTLCDAQTGTPVLTESQSTCTEAVPRAEGSSMTEGGGESGAGRDTHDAESQCQSPTLVHREVNTRRFRRKAKEVQTCYSYVECLLCEHPEKLERLWASKTFTDTSTDPSPPDTHDAATMALSCLSAAPSLVHAGVQTSAASLHDKGVSTSFDWGEGEEEEDALARERRLGLECQDAATSTESLPYIGLLSEIDVDELIVIPEANFELVCDSDEESVCMVDDETLTEVLDYVEVGTQTVVLPMSGAPAGSQHAAALPPPQDDFSKHLVSVGVNTVPKVTFEKETSTPIRHLFSKGTMTFFVAKMDKATSTFSQTRCLDCRQGAAGGGGRVVKEASSRPRAMDSKVTMTNRTEQRDMAVETDSTLVEGRITQCISKLRHVSERLNSPTLRKTVEGDAFFGQSFLAQRSRESSLLHSPSSPKYLSSPTTPPTDSSSSLLSPPRGASTEEAQRQTQLHNLLAETDAVLKSKDSLGVRKAQPITTPRTPSSHGRSHVSNYASQSFPRPRSLDRQNRVKMGSQATSPTRLPLSRYNSAPGRIATVPAQLLLQRKTAGPTSPRTSPSKIPVSQKAAAAAAAAATAATSSVMTSDPGPESEAFATSPTQKVQQRPSLPSISETRTPSSCSETSFVSLESGESSLNPLSVMTTSHSRTPSNVTTTDTASDAMQTKSSAETLCTDWRESNEDDSSSTCSTSTALLAPPPGATPPSPALPSPGKQKKEKKGFMQRFLPGKKKRDAGSSDKGKTKGEKIDAGSSDKGRRKGEKVSSADASTKARAETLSSPAKAEDVSKSKPAPSSPQIPKKPAPQPKTHKGARPKNAPKRDAGKAAVSASSEAPPLHDSSPGSRPASVDSAQFSMQASAPTPAPGPALPPHHYPPLPDPNKTPPLPRKPRPFVYVRQRIFSIQQDNVEEVTERKEKEKEEKKEKKDTEEAGKDPVEEKDKEAEKDKETERDRTETGEDRTDTEREDKEKGKTKVEEQAKVAALSVKVKSSDRSRVEEGKRQEKAATPFGIGRTAAVAKKEEAMTEIVGDSQPVRSTPENGKSSEKGQKMEKRASDAKKSESKKRESKTRSWIRGK